MPGYPPLSSSISGAAAESARAAESLSRGGAPEQAVVLLEEALAASLAISPVLPGWLCGRLASVYRTLGRLDDEVRLLEKYRDSQVDEDARSRYDARLSKARTLAERRRKPESGALSSIRHAVRSPRRPRATGEVTPPPAAPAEAVSLLVELFRVPTDDAFAARLDDTLARYCTEARARQVPMELLVEALRAAARETGATEPAQSLRYNTALVRLLALHFAEDQAAG